MRKFYLLLLSLTALTLFNCSKNIETTPETNWSDLNTTPMPVMASVHGLITDENNLPAVGVSVKLGSSIVTTDSKGYFIIEDAALDKNASCITAEKTGYFKSYRSFSATEDMNFVSIRMIKRTVTGTFNAGAGGTVTITGGSSLVLPASGIIKASDGSSYSGTVNVYAAYIDPSQASISDIIPGSFMADDKNNQRTTLESFGMIAVEMQTSSGEKLQLANGKSATVSMAIPASLQASSPSTISLWYLNEATGIWKEDGVATKVGNAYVGSVTHFSFWNCDVGMPAVKLNIKVQDTGGAPMVHVRVKLVASGLTSRATTYGYTDQNGEVSGLVPINAPLTLYVLDKCNGVVYQQSIGSFSANTILPPITVTNSLSQSLITVKGKLVTCTNTPVTKGTAIIVYNNIPRYVRVDTNGNFSSTIITCLGGSTTFTIVAIDDISKLEGNHTVSLTSPITNTGNLQACGVSTLNFVNFTLDGVSRSVTKDVFMSSSSGSATTTLGIQAGMSTSDSFIVFTYLVTDNSVVGGIGAWDMKSLRFKTFKSKTIVQPFKVNITQTAPLVGDYFEGNFSGNFIDSSNVTHQVSANFRKRRVF